MDTLMYSSPSGKLSPRSWVGFLAYKQNVSNIVELANRLIQRIATDAFWRENLTEYKLFTSRTDRREYRSFDWSTLPDELQRLLVNESNGSIELRGGTLERDFGVGVLLNYVQFLIYKRIDGKRRPVPEIADRGCFHITIPAYESENEKIKNSFMTLACDWFVLTDSQHGIARHRTIKEANGYDSGNRDFYNPEFVTWANWFGREWVEAKGRAYVLAAPAHEIRELSNGAVMMTICESPMEQMGISAQKAGYELKKYLGIVSPSERDGQPPFAPKHPADW